MHSKCSNSGKNLDFVREVTFLASTSQNSSCLFLKSIKCHSMNRQNVSEIEFPFLIMDQLSDAICCVDRMGYIVHFNNHFSFISGYTSEDTQNPIFFPH